MRPKLHLPGPVLQLVTSTKGTALLIRASGDMACSSFGRLRCDTLIYSRAARYKPVDSSEAAELEAAL